MSLSLCLFVHDHVSGTTRVIITKFFVHVAYRRGSVHVDDRLHCVSAGRGWRECTVRAKCNLWLIALLFFFHLLPCGRLSWLFFSFWAHVNVYYSIRSYHIVLISTMSTREHLQRDCAMPEMKCWQFNVTHKGAARSLNLYCSESPDTLQPV